MVSPVALMWLGNGDGLKPMNKNSFQKRAFQKKQKTYSFTTPRGEQIEMYGGKGPYQFDNTYKAIAFRSFDWANLFVVFPIFIAGLILFRRNKFRGQLLLAALFTYLAYIYLIGVMGNAFNAMFLVWTALFSTGVFGLYLTLNQMDFAALPTKLVANFPRKSVAIYMVVTTVLVFTTSIVFVALSISLLLFHLSYGPGDLLDMAITFGITIVASGFSIAIFKRVRDK